MYKDFYKTIPSMEEYKKAVYLLKGRFDNITVLPIEEMGEDIYAITIGEQKNSILISCNITEKMSALTLVLYRFLQELALAAEQNLPICEIFPSKLLQKISITIIPSLCSTEDITIYFIRLCDEWQIKRLYTLSFGSGVISCPKIEESPSQSRLMAELIGGGCNYPTIWADSNISSLTNNFVKEFKKPAFDIEVLNKNLSLDLENWVNSSYESLKESLMLMLVV